MCVCVCVCVYVCVCVCCDNCTCFLLVKPNWFVLPLSIFAESRRNEAIASEFRSAA